MSVTYIHGLTDEGIPFEIVRNGLRSYAIKEGDRSWTVNPVDLLLYLMHIQYDLEHKLGPRYEEFKNQIRKM